MWFSEREPDLELVITAQDDWESYFSNTLSLVRGKSYKTAKPMPTFRAPNGGWIFVCDSNGQNGIVPMSAFTPAEELAAQSTSNVVSSNVVPSNGVTSNVVSSKANKTTQSKKKKKNNTK